MDEEQKKQVTAAVHSTAGKVAAKANEQGKASTGWKKWLWGALAVLAGAVAWFTAGCSSLTPGQVSELYRLLEEAQEVLHAEGGK